jgi:hypothetical protein
MIAEQFKAISNARVATHAETTAARFIDLLSPVSGILSGPGGLPHGRLYRGVGDASYSLLPAAFRQNAKLLQPPNLARGPGQTNGRQIYREFHTLLAFIEAAGRQGHQIPEDTQQFREEVRSLADKIDLIGRQTITEWPPLSFLSIMALAQHYGVPTRMLDWSLDPYVAAYFAAKSASKDANQTGNLAVWVLADTLFTVTKIMLLDDREFARLPIQYVKTPWAGNANAKAQRAVFLAYRQFDIDPGAPFECPPYDKLLASTIHESLRDISALYCLTLPKKQASELLRLLAFQGYDGATIFPGLEGAVESISELYLWPEDIGPDPRTPESKAIFAGLVA